jgi:DNA (cytosine-5)-methyltransferase 1
MGARKTEFLEAGSETLTKFSGDRSVIDVFSGVGGLSLGAARAGYRVAGAAESDARTRAVYASNFPTCRHIQVDLTKLTGAELLRMVALGSLVCGLIGGPPCQGFSRIGRRSPDDPRNSLFEHFFRLVAEIRPRFFLAENVLGILDAQFDSLRREAFGRLDGYAVLEPLVLKASNYGAATSRERVFFIGYLPEYFDYLEVSEFDPPKGVPALDVETALRGLRRKVSPHWQRQEQGWRRLTCRPEGWFWKKVFDDIPIGVGNPEAVRRLQEDGLVSGCLGTRHTQRVVERFNALPEGAVDRPSRAVRLKRKGVCPTLRSGTGPERGSYQALRPVHPSEPRVITPREAARLQGFPDWFLFDSTKWHSFRQIGNSVSPILAEHLLRTIRAKEKWEKK